MSTHQLKTRMEMTLSEKFHSYLSRLNVATTCERDFGPASEKTAKAYEIANEYKLQFQKDLAEAEERLKNDRNIR